MVGFLILLLARSPLRKHIIFLVLFLFRDLRSFYGSQNAPLTLFSLDVFVFFKADEKKEGKRRCVCAFVNLFFHT